MSSSNKRPVKAECLLAKFRAKHNLAISHSFKEKKLLQSIDDLEKSLLQIKEQTQLPPETDIFTVSSQRNKRSSQRQKENSVLQKQTAPRKEGPPNQLKKVKKNLNGKKMKNKEADIPSVIFMSSTNNHLSLNLPLKESRNSLAMCGKFADILNQTSKRISEQRKSFFSNKRNSLNQENMEGKALEPPTSSFAKYSRIQSKIRGKNEENFIFF